MVPMLYGNISYEGDWGGFGVHPKKMTEVSGNSSVIDKL